MFEIIIYYKAVMKAGMTGISRLLPSHLEIVGWGIVREGAHY